MYGSVYLLNEKQRSNKNKKSLLSEAALCAKTLLNHYDEILSFLRFHRSE